MSEKSFTDYHKKLVPYAYNILGSTDDARDAVQDVLIKHLQAPDGHALNEFGYLVRSVVNHSINLKKRNAKLVRGEVWLPEPVSTEFADRYLHRKEMISYSLMVLLENLNPKERAVFILKEAFDYSHEEIGGVLDIAPENSRKLLSRAKLKLQDRHHPVAAHGKATGLAGYIQAMQAGDVNALEQMLATDVVLYADGGGRVNIVSSLTRGLQPVSDLILYLYKTYQASLEISPIVVNNQPAILFSNNGTVINCQVFDLDPASGKIRQIFSVVDPMKLKGLEQG
ncbi:RNA polymerase subunit sigma-24 [Pedobacter yulinensis]|uniref:RNA polymerase subunit sigma-24 n=1 Tax=Pedobacter yulinensis TaxID=2126353 RepID=A0A2T3HJH2_9SPHI|nr:sigma-70 family RNA polymerase sigma factor [Pedobacter yulinensis]PST82605.1 RNA polymerase subunit sigma-24 [Pedobacter yulinensis]